MTRTWDDNRQAINQLWPMNQLTEEERRLWSDDLSRLNQDMLYDALRNVKRNHDSNYPQIKWIRDEYRTLDRLASLKSRRPASAEAKVPVIIDTDAEARMRDDLKVMIETATPADKDATVDMIADKAGKCEISMATAFRLVRYLLERLGLSNGMRFGGSL